MERSTTLTISLPLDVLAKIDDAAAKNNNQPRSHWLRDAALARLGADENARSAAPAIRALDRSAPQPIAAPTPNVRDAEAEALLAEIFGGADAK